MMRTDAAARPALHGTRSERWDRVVSGAAEQCGRAVVPLVAATTTLDALHGAPFAGPRIVLLGAGDSEPLGALSPRPSEALLLVGPAGGFDLSEIERLRASGFRPASLGPRVLRTETAAVAAVCVAQMLWGDLGTRADPSG
jgi:16S rRNA (uracil1498-N3)-methyltransferase